MYLLGLKTFGKTRFADENGFSFGRQGSLDREGIGPTQSCWSSSNGGAGVVGVRAKGCMGHVVRP